MPPTYCFQEICYVLSFGIIRRSRKTKERVKGANDWSIGKMRYFGVYALAENNGVGRGQDAPTPSHDPCE